MADWYLAPCLERGRLEVNARWPRRDKRSDGTVGDESHQQRTSDHNPNSRGSVNAWDIDVNGVDIPLILRHFQTVRGAHYWIYDRRIADADNDWRPTQYTGSDPHTGHAHLSIRQSVSAEQNVQSWGIYPPEGTEDMSVEDDIYRLLEQGLRPPGTAQTSGGGVPVAWIVREIEAIKAGLSTILANQSVQTSLIEGIGRLDPVAFANALAASPEALDALTSAMRDQLPLIPTAQEVAKAILVWISAGVHNGAPT